MNDKTEKEWEELKLRIFHLEDEMTVAAMIIEQYQNRISNLETTLATILADQYPHIFMRCQYCKSVAEKSMLEDHEKDCPKNPDNVYH